MDSICYSFDAVPELGETFEVAPGVQWLRMRLPMALNHINLYLLEDRDGWFIVDCGINDQATREAWQVVLAKTLAGKPVKGVFATHLHPDHTGLAGWLCEEFHVPLYMTFMEYLNARAFMSVPKQISWAAEQFYRRAGIGQAFIDGMRTRIKGFSAFVAPLPPFERLVAGQTLCIGGRSWRVVVGSGHSPEHCCLLCEELGILISGDQVIPRITSNVSVTAMEPEANPLREWLVSHERFLKTLPEDLLVLPAHDTPFTGLHFRLRQLIEHHEERMLAIEEVCVEPQTTMALLPVLFEMKLDDSQIGMALGECIAHLHLLMDRKRIERRLDVDGLYRYHSIDPSLEQRTTHRHPKESPPFSV